MKPSGLPLKLFLVAITLPASVLQARYTFFTPDGSYAIEVSADNYDSLRLPIYRNAITSLVVLNDHIVGGTSASPRLSPFVFTASLSKRRLEDAVDLETVVPGQRAIQSGFGRGRDGTLYAGTLPQQEGTSGHLIEVKISGSEIQISDLGQPIPGEGVFTLTHDPERGRIYGLTHPSGLFFVFDLRTRTPRIFEETMPSRRVRGSLSQYGLEPKDFLSRALVLDRQGRVYGSQPINRIFRFDPETDRMHLLEDELPEVWGRRSLGRLDSGVISPDGILYGGNSADGQLFRLDPATAEVTNLGKPIMMNRLKALVFAADGKLYGVAGDLPGYAHLFSYEPEGGGFRDLGNPRFTMTAPGIEQGIFWRGFQIGTMAVSEDGSIVVLGEEESLSQLLIFPVEAKDGK